MSDRISGCVRRSLTSVKRLLTPSSLSRIILFAIAAKIQGAKIIKKAKRRKGSEAKSSDYLVRL